MKMMRTLLSSSFIRLLLMAAVVFFTLSGTQDAYQIYLQEVVVEESESPDQVVLLARGGNLYRPNSFYLDGKRIDDATVEKSTYEQCYITLSRSVFTEGKWHRMELGFSKWGIINLLSSPIWVEWIY